MNDKSFRYVKIDSEKLKSKRCEKVISQASLAELAGLHVNTISSIESNKNGKTRLDSAKRIADALEITMAELLVKNDIYEDSIRETSHPLNISGENVKKLTIDDSVDEPLKKAVAGLILENGSKERVSNAIAMIAGYLKSIVCRVPELKNNTLWIVDSIISTLLFSELDNQCTSIENHWSVIKVALSELMSIECVSVQAKKEADEIIKNIQQARLYSDDIRWSHVIKSLLYWLRDYWNLICIEPIAYSLLASVSCIMSSAPTDYETRYRLTTSVNNFATYVAIYDPVYKAIHIETKNKES